MGKDIHWGPFNYRLTVVALTIKMRWLKYKKFLILRSHKTSVWEMLSSNTCWPNGITQVSSNSIIVHFLKL